MDNRKVEAAFINWMKDEVPGRPQSPKMTTKEFERLRDAFTSGVNVGEGDSFRILGIGSLHADDEVTPKNPHCQKPVQTFRKFKKVGKSPLDTVKDLIRAHAPECFGIRDDDGSDPDCAGMYIIEPREAEIDALARMIVVAMAKRSLA